MRCQTAHLSPVTRQAARWTTSASTNPVSQQALSATWRPLGCSVDLCVPLAGLTQEEYICTGSHAQRLVAAATALLLDGNFQGVGSACRKPPEFS